MNKKLKGLLTSKVGMRVIIGFLKFCCNLKQLLPCHYRNEKELIWDVEVWWHAACSVYCHGWIMWIHVFVLNKSIWFFNHGLKKLGLNSDSLVIFVSVRSISFAILIHVTVERSLSDLFSSEEIEMTIEGHGRQAAEINSELTEAPQVLLLTLNRLRYDATEQAVVKVTDQ